MNVNLVATNDSPSIENHNNILIEEINNIPSRGCKSLILNHVLNYLTDEQLEEVLEKLRHGGSISVTSPDAMEASSALYWGTIDINTFSSLTAGRLKQYTILDVKNFFEQRGYSVETATIQDLSFHVKARRP
tara:strand:- start:158 stop:553 length:396 start_codon:yes stop_codon:yes gene_type:complete